MVGGCGFPGSHRLGGGGSVGGGLCEEWVVRVQVKRFDEVAPGDALFQRAGRREYRHRVVQVRRGSGWVEVRFMCGLYWVKPSQDSATVAGDGVAWHVNCRRL